MKKIITSKAIKKAYESVDDQPNFVNRDNRQQDIIWNKSLGPDTDKDIKRKFKKKKKKNV